MHNRRLFHPLARFLSALLLCFASHSTPAADIPGALRLPGFTFTLQDRPAFVFLPPEDKRSNPQAWVFYAPTLPGYPDEAERWMHEQFLAAGIAVAGIDVGEAYGSPKSHPYFEALYQELTKKHDFASKPVLLGRSRGGLWVTSWAAAHPERVAGIAGIYPVFDFRTYPGLEKAAPAYDLTPQELAARLDSLNPISLVPKLARAGIPACIIHGDVDKVVPLEPNSAQFLQVYKDEDAAGLVELIILPGQGHSFYPGFFHSEKIVQFTIQQAKKGAQK